MLKRLFRHAAGIAQYQTNVNCLSRILDALCLSPLGLEVIDCELHKIANEGLFNKGSKALGVATRSVSAKRTWLTNAKDSKTLYEG